METRVQKSQFDPGAELTAFTERMDGVGAVVSFTGIVRQVPQGDLQQMLIEHYPGMTERALEAFRRKAVARWDLAGALVIHRYGQMQLGEVIMMVATASRQRVAAFEAAEFLMDYLKSRAPFWKKEITTRGAFWVAATEADEAALKRW